MMSFLLDSHKNNAQHLSPRLQAAVDEISMGQEMSNYSPETLSRDKQLTDQQTRSRWVEGLIKRAIKPVHASFDPTLRHEWFCLACEHAWHTNRPKEQTFACAKRHCRSEKIEYVGIFNMGSEE